MRYTSGPWTEVEHNEGCEFPSGVAVAVHRKSEPFKQIGCICHMVGQGEGKYDPEITTNNAKLIAAAPEMYELLLLYEEWEANLILDNNVWVDETGLLISDSLLEKLIELQTKRNAVLKNLRK